MSRSSPAPSTESVGEHLLRGLRDGTVDLTGCPIRVDGHDAALTTRPHLAQGVRQQRKGSPIGVADEDLHEARLQDEPGLLCGLLDHGSEPAGASGVSMSRCDWMMSAKPS